MSWRHDSPPLPLISLRISLNLGVKALSKRGFSAASVAGTHLVHRVRPRPFAHSVRHSNLEKKFVRITSRIFRFADWRGRMRWDVLSKSKKSVIRVLEL